MDISGPYRGRRLDRLGLRRSIIPSLVGGFIYGVIRKPPQAALLPAALGGSAPASGQRLG
jgi:hypothetical protein